MKKTHKKIVGFLGLLAVVAMTAVAAVMPVPDTQATSITDTITVQVVNGKPDVSIGNMEKGYIITSPMQVFTVSYSNVETAKLVLTHTDLNGKESKYTLDEFSPNYNAGSKCYTIFFTE